LLLLLLLLQILLAKSGLQVSISATVPKVIADELVVSSKSDGHVTKFVTTPGSPSTCRSARK
jgi:hypothetical protein